MHSEQDSRSVSTSVRNGKLYYRDGEVVVSDEVEDKLKELISKPATRRLGVRTFHSIVAQQYEGISRTLVEKFLSSLSTYQHYRPEKPNVPQHRIFHNVADMVFIDFIDIQKDSSHNKRFEYVLTAVDGFSKKAWCFPVRGRDMEYQSNGWPRMSK